jgi:hypothetical protein
MKFFCKVLIIACCLTLTGCASLASWWGQTGPAIKADAQKVETALAPLIPAAQKTLAALQKDYPFWAGIVQGTLNLAGIKAQLPPAATVLPYIQVADTSLAILGAALNQQPVDPNLLQNAILQAENVAPGLKAQLLADPAVQAAYNTWVAQQAAVGAVAPAVPESSPNPTPATGNPPATT